MLKGIIRYFIVLGFAISNVNAQIIGGMNPNDDFDGDGIINSIDIDDDNDGIPDEVESHPPTYCHGNIVVNGDFSNGFSGFTTTYSTANITQPGNIAVCNNCFMGAPSNFSVSKGNNLQVNGGGLSTFWCQTLTVQPNTTYTISFYAFKATNDSKFEVTYNGAAFMTVNLDASPAGWNFYTSTFTVGNTSSVNICLKNLGTTVGASDYVIDDICVVAQNYVRPPLDTDGDGIPNSLDRDSDNDGCSDAFESGSTTNKTDSIIAGPYGTNGLANSKENVADNGIINYSLTYDFAINSNINSCLDKDLDNVNNILDIDDDNDGILDHIESPTCFFTASDLNNNITVSTELSMHASYVIQSAFDKNEATSSVFAPNADWVGKELFKIQSPTYVQITGISLDLWNWALSSSSSNTFKLQASNDNINWIDLSNPLASTATSGVFIVPNTLSPNNSYKLYRIIGVAGLSYYGGVKEITMNFSSNFNTSSHPKQNCIGSDFDNDGIPNHLDLDSDNDGCKDAYEGGASINKTDSIIVGPYGTNGLANSKEIVADNGVINYNLTYSFASNNLLNACLDTDNDGIGNIIDIDDDNDGVPDIMELSCVPFSINGTCTNAQLNTALYGITSHCSDWKGFDYDPSPSNTIITNFDYLGVYTNGYPRFDLQGSTGSSATTVLHGKMYKDFSTVPGMTYTFQVELLSSFVDVEGIKPNLKAIDLSSNQELASTYLNGSGMRSISFIATGTITTISIGLDQRPSIPYSGPNQFWVQNSFTVNGNPYQDCVSMDTDGDGIPNHLDLDSDNDGCSDAFESGASINITDSIIPGPYGANGLANSKEISIDNGVINYISYYDTFALNSTIKACLDTDKDGIADIIDIDDDNDGIPDLVECPSSQPAPFIFGTTYFGVETALPALNYNFNGGTLAALTDGNLQTYFNLSAVQADNNIVTVDIPLLTPQTANLFYLWNDWGAVGDELKDFEVELIDASNNVLQTLVARAPIGLTKTQYFKFPSISTGITKIRLKLKTWWRHNQGNSQISEIALGLDDSYCDDDNDGIPNQLDLDSDNDGCSDAFESAASLNKNDTIVAGPYGNNGLANSKETALDNGILNFQNTYYLATDSSSNTCIDTDNDGISDLIDLDDDNDGVLDMDECNTNIQLCFDGSFGTQTLTSIATYGCLKTVNASPDLLLPSWSTFAPGTPASPDGGAFYSIVYLKGTWNESSEFPVTGLKVGAKYKINFHQMVVGHGNSWHDGGYFIFRDKTTGSVIARSNFMNPTNPSGAFRAWEKQSLTFVATSSNMTIQIFGSTNDPNSTIGTRLALDGFDIQALMDCDDDGDGIPNHLDLDSDNDGCSDALEAGATTDTTKNFKFLAPFGTNGLANSKETVADNGIINYTLTYNYATNNSIKACIDSDGDGINDINDIDDDNDGILDIAENCTLPNPTLASTYSRISGNYAVVDGVVENPTKNGTVKIVTTAVSGSSGVFGTPLREIATGDCSNSPLDAGVRDVTFSKEITNAVFSAYGFEFGNEYQDIEILAPYTGIPQIKTIEIIGGATIQQLAVNKFRIKSGVSCGNGNVCASSAVFQISGVFFSKLRISGDDPVQASVCRLIKIGLDDATTSECNADTDGDGIPNHLDLDSDNDGCKDSYEGGSTTNKNDSIITGPYGTNGLANSKETATDNGVINYNLTYGLAINNLVKTCLDTDNDGIADYIDLDDDNDGILDTDECGGLATVYLENFQTNTVNPYNSSPIYQPGVSVNGQLDAIGANGTSKSLFHNTGGGTYVAGDVVWGNKNAIAVIPNKSYEISYYMNDNGGGNPPQIEMLANGVKLGNTATSTTSWVKYTYNWNSGSNTTLSISLRNLTGTGQGNDFRLDEITVLDKCTDLDTDGDGIINSKDLDSDNDGCSDAVEAGTTFISTSGITTANQLTATIIPAPYGTNGFANGLETVADNGTYKGTYSYSFATNAAVKACTDSDKDGLVDVYDLDDDNDGILDEVECASQICSSPILNGSFESNPIAANTYSLVDASTVSGWKTTSTDNLIELWGTGNASVPAANGVVFAEITASQSSSILYQKLCVTPGSVIEWSVKHRGRAGVEVAELQIGASLTSLVTQKSMSDGTTAWGTHTGSYTIPSTQQETYIAFKVISPLNGSGNLIDDLIVVIKSAGECTVDSDNDGIPNRLDLDSDNDGCSDAFEAGSTINLTDSIIAGPYGTNGLANSKETVTDNGIINYTLTYNRAINSSIKPCVKPDISGNIKSHCQKPGIYQVFAIPNPTNSGATLNWYSVPTGGTASSTAPTVNTANVGVYTFWVSQTLNGVESAREEVQITVAIAPATPGAISGPTSITQGSVNLHNIAAVAGATSYVWTLPNGWSGTSTTSTIIDTAGSTGGFITVKASNNGCESAAASLQVFVSPKPPKPTISIDSFSYCQGDTASQLSATPTPANSGGILNWYTVPAGGTASSVAPTPNTNTSGIFTFFVSQTVNNIESDRAPIFVRVNAKPAQPVQINGLANIQANNSYTYSVTAIPGATSYTWTLPNGWSGTSTTNSITINSNTTTTGTLKVKANADSCSSAEQTLIINTLPVKPDLSDNTNLSGDSIVYCQGATATQLQAKANPSGNGGTIKWYTQATGGSALASAPTPSTTLAGTTTYYVSQTVNNIESERAPIRVIVKPTLSQPTAIQGATAVQASTSQTYSVTAVPGATSYTWSLPNGWTGTSTTNSITINTNTTTSGIVSVTANVNGCSSTAQTLTVGNLPTKPDLSDNTNLSGDSIVYCQGATATQLQAKTNPANNGGTIKWYTQATGGSALASAPTPNTTFSSLTTYYVSQTVNSIESERTAIRVIVRPTPSQPNSIQGNTTVVASTSNTYSVNAVSGATSYSWTLPGGWSGTSTTNSIVVTSGTTGGTIRVVAHVGPCSSTEQTLLVNIQGGGPNIDDNKNIVGNTIKYCVGAKADPLVAKATIANAILVWYTQPTGGSPSVMAPTPNTTSVDTQRYYVSQIANGQESLRTQIVVIVTDQNCPLPCMNNLVPDITPLFITNTCPDTTADLTSIETKNQPNGSVLRWFTSLPASEQTRVLNPSQVKTGTYYAVFYNPTDSCYSLNGDTATKVQVITSSCTNCNAGHVAPKLSTIGLSNICPSTTADLTLVTASNQPKGTTLEWHTSVPVSSATKVANPKSVTAGIYYAVFFDATNNCYSNSGTLATPLVVSITSCPNPCQAGPIAPKVSQEVLTNICPSTTANLTTITASNTPSGAVLQWHTGVPATSFNKVTNPSAVLGGTYYAVFFDATNNCYSGNGFGMYAVDVVITNCPNTCQAGTTKPSLSVNSLDNLCPKTTVDLTSVTASNRPAGTVLQWHTEMPATASNRVTTPSAVGAGTYYAIFYDTLNKCYTTQGYGSTPILVNITNCPNPCNSGNFAPEIIGSDVITNTCPSTTVNLNQFQVLNQPAGTTLVWHSKLPASSLNRIANPSMYNISGKVYGLYFDSKNNCYSQGGQFGVEVQVILTSCPDTCRSGKETPKTSGSDELTNICPSLTTNLTNVIIINKPTSGSVVVQWHTALPATALNRIKTPSSVNSGVYYAVFYDTLQKCYSLLGQDGMQVNVTNTTCPKCLSPNQVPSFGEDSIGTDCPSTTANLNTISVNNKPKGVVVRWYTSPQILSSNVVSNPSAVGTGMYYATFYDTANNCFANNGAGLFTPIKVSLTVCCNSGYQVPKLSAKELTNLCPDSMADLTRISATNQPTGVVLEWHTKTPAQSSTKVSNPYAVNPGIYYGVFYDVVNDCYTDGGIYTTPISVTRKACTTCNAGEAAPLLNTEGISNACPSTTADLTKITAGNRPVGIVMEWHTSSTVTATSRVSNPSAVGAGTYYAIFYDPTNTCYAGKGQATTKIIVTISNCSSPCNAGTIAPALSQKTVTNVCPSTTANLSNISASNRPAGTNLQWHTALPATTSNRVVNPNAVSTGTYYALFYDPTNNCYSGNGYGAQHVEVVIRNCNSTNPCDTMQTSPVLKSDTAINTCPSLTVNLSTLENPSINGYVITWHKGTPATDANRLDSPQFAKAGTYYASYYDTARTCYSLSGKATKQVTVTTFNCPLCYAGSEAPRLSVSTLNNNCPTATADLTQITTFNLPKNTQLTWHTSVPANATNRVANPSAVSNAGTYYAVFFDATNTCYSGNGNAATSVTVTLLDCNNLCAAGTASPKLNISNGTLKNICPAVFANLTSVTASNKPTAGQVVLQWHTALPANATNRVILPSSVTSGTYYAIFYDTVNKCYAGNGNQATQVVVSIENCTNTCIAGSKQPEFNTDILRNSCPNLTADLTLLVSKNQPKGTVIEWRMESGQVVANPKSVTSGRYVALFKDTVNNCYSSGTLNPLTVIQISCKEQVAKNDYTQINNKKPGVTVIDLTKNDTLTTGSKYSITPNGNPKRGTATIDPITGKLSYTITDTSFVGYDTITYQLCDTITNKCSTAYVIIALSNPKDTTVSNIDGKPEVVIPLDSVTGIPIKPVDAKGSYVIDTNPTNGTATIDSNGKLVYRPNAGACGKDSVKVSRIYSFSDGRPNEVYSYWVYIENPPCGPIAKNDYEQISNKKPGVTVIDLSKNDKEPLSGSKYSITPNGNPKRGTATIDPITGKLSYTIIDTSFVGYDTITYQLCDTITNKCSTAYVIIALSNPKDTTVSNIDGKPEVVIPLDSVTGIPIKPVDAKGSYVIDTNPTNGTATIDSNGKLVYRPNAGACGKDSVKVSRIYSFSDGRPNEVYSYWVYIENPPCDDEIPNYISPNGDGANDKFVLPASMRKKYPNLRLSIYNRWGNMVWRSNGVYQNNWGGEHYDASNLPDGVYYYIIELENQNEKARTGFIQVMRH